MHVIIIGLLVVTVILSSLTLAKVNKDKESEHIKQHNSTLHTYDKGSRAVNYEDKRIQICGRCNKTLKLSQTSKVYLNQHFNTKACKKATPTVILKTDNINIHY